MSRATLYVLFPDGTVRYGIYNGTMDIAQPSLVATPRQAWDGREASDGWDDDPVPVQIATDYGGGFSWVGEATPTELTAGFETWGTRTDGLPDWAVYPKATEGTLA